MDKSGYAPFNDNISENPDKEFISGPYSTFDVELSKYLLKKDRTIADIKLTFEKAAENISQKKLIDFNVFLGNQLAKLLLRDDIRKRLRTFNLMSDAEKLIFAQDLIEGMTKVFDNPGYIIPKLPVVSTDKVSVMGFSHDTDDGNELWINFTNPVNQDVASFIRGLLHEFVHIFDYYMPNKGPLGEQITNISWKTGIAPDEDRDAYFSNPTEINAYLNYRFIPELVTAIKNLLDDQNQIDIYSRQMFFSKDFKMKD